MIDKAIERTISISLFLAVVVASCIYLWSLEPSTEGDGTEYYLTNQSFFNHFSFNQRPEDVSALKEVLDHPHLESYPVKYNYFASLKGKLYGCHFWLYPLAAVPAKSLLHRFGGDEKRVFQITNAFFFLLATYAILFLTKASFTNRAVFFLLHFFSPILWFINWSHPEVFVYSLLTLAFVCYLNESYLPATFLSSVAAMQFQPLAVLSLGFAIIALGSFYTAGISIPRKLFYGFLACLALFLNFIPSIWYYSKFAKYNLLSSHGYASFQSISIGKILAILFDLNTGMLPYMPAVIVLFSLSLLVIFKNIKGNIDLILLLAIAATLAACAVNTLWNSGTDGPHRYALYVLPAFNAVIVKYFNQAFEKLFISLAVFSIFLQILITGSNGFYEYRGPTYLKHSSVAKFVLDHSPKLYNPLFDVFAVRTLERWFPSPSFPVLYVSSAGRPTKILCSGSDKEQLLSMLRVGADDREKIERLYEKHAGQQFYLNLADLDVHKQNHFLFSGGFDYGDKSVISISGKNLSANKRGINVVVINQGEIQKDHFETHGYPTEADRLASFLHSLKQGSLVILSVKDEAATNLNDSAAHELRRLGARHDLKETPRCSYLLVAKVGAPDFAPIELCSCDSPVFLMGKQLDEVVDAALQR
mgnify:CR=1 FL=1